MHAKHIYSCITNLIFQIFGDYFSIIGFLCNLTHFILSLSKRAGCGDWKVRGLYWGLGSVLGAWLLEC